MASRITNLSFENAKFNNRLAYLLNCLSVVVLLFCGIHYTVYHLFKVEKIIIQGNISHVTPVQLSYIAKNKLHGTLFTLDISGLKTEFQQIPWVRQVSLKRHFPHTIIVTLEEYRAVARIGDDNLIADDGEIFDGADDDASLPTLYVSLNRVNEAMLKYQQINQALNPLGESVNKLWISSPRVVRFLTSKNVMITLCDSNLSARLQELNQYWSRLNRQFAVISSLNLCYRNAIAVAYTPASVPVKLSGSQTSLTNTTLKGITK